MTDRDRSPRELTVDVLAERLEGFRELVLQRFDDGIRLVTSRMDRERIQRSEFEATVKTNHAEQTRRQNETNVRLREQNGNISKAIDRVSRVEQRQTEHDKHHGLNDANIGDRLGLLEKDRNQEQAVKLAIAQQKAAESDRYKILLVGISVGISGAALVFTVLKFFVDVF